METGRNLEQSVYPDGYIETPQVNERPSENESNKITHELKVILKRLTPNEINEEKGII